MAGLAIAGGSAVRGLELSLPAAAVVLQRHGTGEYTPPHRIDHVANMRRLADAGCDRVLAIGSVGGLRSELGPGTFLCPDDFIAPGAAPSLFDDERAHEVPGFDHAWRSRLVMAWADAATPPLVDGGVYWQSRGPRLETPAEVRLIAAHADVVGMTIASEAVIARELGLAYAAVCVVENLANGVGATELTMDELLANRAANREALLRALESVVPVLA
jgi:5'-methylthioadenosine phosphorylase